MHLLEQLGREIGHTPLHEVAKIPIPNDNRVFIKLESQNLSGTHYDRVYLNLFRKLEIAGKIHRGRTRLIETSSGSAGRSVAEIGKFLGYDVTVVVPGQLPAARIDAIKLRGAKVVEADGPTVSDAVTKLRELLLEDERRHPKVEDRFFCMNHSRDLRSLEAMDGLADEVRDALPQGRIDAFVGACGNGTSLVGVGRRLKQIYPDLKVIGVEPEETCPVFRTHVARTQGSDTKNSYRAHDVYGTGVSGVHFPFFDDRLALSVLDNSMVVAKTDRETALVALNNVEGLDAGRSTALCFAAILQLCSESRGRTYLTIQYDSLSRFY